MSHQRSIVHMDLDTFFVSCERLQDSSLNGKPILIGGDSDRGVVASCSYEARQFGIHSAMPMKMAKLRCPEAVIIKGNSASYTAYSQQVSAIIREAVPLFEMSSIDEFYADLSGMDRFFGCMQYASELRERIRRETGLPISFGLSENKTVSKIATGLAKPDNKIRIEHGTERSFLAPLSVRKIPMIGLKTYQALCEMGVRTISTIQQMQVEMMQSAFGDNGVSMWRKANGIDLSPVVPYSERKSISTERTFEQDTIDVMKVKAILLAMAETLTLHLRRENKLTACVTIKIRFSDFQTKTLQKRIHYTSADHEILPLVRELFEKAYDRRVLIRLIGVRFSELVNGHYQLSLFNDSDRMSRLYRSMDLIRDRYGDRAVVRATGMETKSVRRGSPFNGLLAAVASKDNED
jgi:DNA polymerase IV